MPEINPWAANNFFPKTATAHITWAEKSFIASALSRWLDGSYLSGPGVAAGLRIGWLPRRGWAWLLVLTNRTGWSSFWTAGNIPSKSELPKIGEIKRQPAASVLSEAVLDKIHSWWGVFSGWETSPESFLESNPIQPFAVISAEPRNYYYYYYFFPF